MLGLVCICQSITLQIITCCYWLFHVNHNTSWEKFLSLRKLMKVGNKRGILSGSRCLKFLSKASSWFFCSVKRLGNSKEAWKMWELILDGLSLFLWLLWSSPQTSEFQSHLIPLLDQYITFFVINNNIILTMSKAA